MTALPAVSGVSRRWTSALVCVLCLVAVLAGAASARTTPPSPGEVALADLPKEARDTYALVGKGGPFPFDRDGIVFGNRERLLPARPGDYYHEYTVRTPGVKTRGARRLVCGGPPRIPDACYYTGDHYRSFRKIRS